MRFSLFELFAWTTFLAICCALVLSGPIGEKIPTPRPVVIVWIAAIILVQQCFSWRVVLGLSAFVGLCLGFAGSWFHYTTSRNASSLPQTDSILAGVALHVFYGAVIGTAVAIAGAVIFAFQQRRN